MSISSLPAVPLLHQPARPDLSKCIICKKKNGTNSMDILSNSAGSRSKIILSSQTLNDGLLDALNEVEVQQILFHSKSCYSRYTLKASRVKEPDSSPNVVPTEPISPNTTTRSSARLSSPPPTASTSVSEKSIDPLSERCTICNFVRKKHVREKYRICEKNRARCFYAAINFNHDDVFTRCALIEKYEDIFAADMYVHKSCIRSYLRQFERDTQSILNSMDSIDEDEEDIHSAFDFLLTTLDLRYHGYDLTACRKFINGILPSSKVITNRAFRILLSNKYGDNIAFTNPHDTSKPQMFYSVGIDASSVVETVRNTDPMKGCTTLLRTELRQYDFGLENSFCDSDDLRVSFNQYLQNRPKMWSTFFSELLQSKDLSDKQQRVCDSVFQIFHSLLRNSTTPLAVSFAESLHDKSRCKHLVSLANRLGFSVSYDTFQRIDTSIGFRTIELAGTNRVPVSPSITSDSVIHGSMDNFDKNDGKGGSHDTILMLFQNRQILPKNKPTISVRTKKLDERKFSEMLPCQTLLPFTKVGRGNIPADYQVSESVTYSEEAEFSDYKIWLLVRYVTSTLLTSVPHVTDLIPSFSALNSALSKPDISVTIQAFTPILPHPATEYDSIYTTMRNFQDVLSQRRLQYGALWCDEGVYRIAKEIQFLNQGEFENIFLGLGGFHMEKIVLACCGQFLKPLGVQNVFVANEIFGPAVAENQVMSGKHYKYSRQGMRLFSEAAERIRFQNFVNQLPIEHQQRLKIQIELLHQGTNKEKPDVCSDWKNFKTYADKDLFILYQKYISDSEIENDKCKCLNLFLDKIMPIAIDLTRSFREGNWKLHLSAVRRAMWIIFWFGHTHYSRWTPIYYEDCLNLEQKYPLLYNSFLQGDFVVHHTSRKCSATPMDQALEMAYNKPAKGPGGVIGFTRQKESVAKWNIIKHEKSKFTTFLDEVCNMSGNDEYSVHHEFSDSITKKEEEDIECIKSCLMEKSLFEPGDICNIFSGKVLEKEESQFLLSCYEGGEELYLKYRQERIVDKTKKILDRIPKPKTKKSKTSKKDQKNVDLKAETLTLVRAIDVARVHGYDMKELLCYEIVSSSFFLTKGQYLRKADKSELVREYKQRKCNLSKFQQSFSSCERKVTIIDFMAFARKMHTWINKFNLKTFGDMFTHMWKTFSELGDQSNRIDIVFDLYKNGTTKASERKRRSAGEETRIKVNNINQSLPKLSEVKLYWSSDENKKEFQHIFISWMIDMYHEEKPVYLGGCHQFCEEEKCYVICNGIKTLVPELESTLDEADDRMMIHVDHATRVDSCTAALICSRDSDVYVSFMYHYSKTWKLQGLTQAWMEDMGMYVPIHTICLEMGDDLVEMLPAAHTLTGCDTTSKIGTKKKALTVLKSLQHFELKTFGIGQLTAQSYQVCEQFLLKCLPKSTNIESFDSLRYSLYHCPDYKIDIEKLPCTSSSLKYHIQRSFMECFKIKNCLMTGDGVELMELCHPEDHGYDFGEDGHLVPIISGPTLPDDFPSPCTCGKCARQNVCPCRVRGTKCTDFCKCKTDCRNPIK